MTELTRLTLKLAAPASQQRWLLMSASDFHLLGDFEGVVNLDAQVPHGRFKVGVAEMQPQDTQVLGAPIGQRLLGPSH